MNSSCINVSSIPPDALDLSRNLETNDSRGLTPISSLATAVLRGSLVEQQALRTLASDVVSSRDSRRSIEKYEEEVPLKKMYTDRSEEGDIEIEKSIADRYRGVIRIHPETFFSQIIPFSEWEERDFAVDEPGCYIEHKFRIKVLKELAKEEKFLLQKSFYISLNQANPRDLGNIHLLMAIGLIHADCILRDDIDSLKTKIDYAYKKLLPEFNDLPFSGAEEVLFEIARQECLSCLENMKFLSIPKRIELMQEISFLEPFVYVFRILAASQILYWEQERESYEELLRKKHLLVYSNLKKIQDELLLSPKDSLGEEAKDVLEYISIAVENCSGSELFDRDKIKESEIYSMKEALESYEFFTESQKNLYKEVKEIFESTKVDRIKFWDSTREMFGKSDQLKKQRLRNRALAEEYSELESDLYALADALDQKICLFSVSDDEFFVLPSQNSSCVDERPIDFYIFHHFTENLSALPSFVNIHPAYCLNPTEFGRADSFNLLIPLTVDGFKPRKSS